MIELGGKNFADIGEAFDIAVGADQDLVIPDKRIEEGIKINCQTGKDKGKIIHPTP